MPLRYPALFRVLHWFMAITILSLFGVGLYMHGLEREDSLRPLLYSLHKSFGVLILCLVIVRVGLRFATRIPPIPKAFAKWEITLAHLTHFALYVLMFGVPVAGIWMSNSWGHGVKIFGLEIPRFFAENREWAPLASEVHEILAWAIVVMAALHIAGALKHRFIDKHDIIYRMSFGKIRSNAAIPENNTLHDQ